MLKPAHWLIVLAMPLVTPLAGCGSSSDDHGHTPGPGSSGSSCPTAQTLTYDNFGKAFMTSYCVRCHASTVMGLARAGAPADHNFDDLASIKRFASHIDDMAAAGPTKVNAMMPADPPFPSEDERRKLGEWLACGAP